AFRSEADAERLAHAVIPESPGTEAKQEGHATMRAGHRVRFDEAKSKPAPHSLRGRIEGPPRRLIVSPGRRPLTFGELIDQLLEVDLICVGESHDSDLNHRVQLQFIQSLYARDGRLGVGMEMFQRPFQKHLDAYLHGDSKEDDFLQATEYRQRWGFEW